MALKRVATLHVVPAGPGRIAEAAITAGDALKVGSTAAYYDVATTYQDCIAVAIADCDAGDPVEAAGPGSVMQLRAGSAVVDSDPLVATTDGEWIPQTTDAVFYNARAVSAASAANVYFWAQIYPSCSTGANISLLTTGA